MPSLWSAVSLSLQVALGCCAMGLPVALPLGWYLARGHGKVKTVVGLLVLVPLVLPPVVTGLLLLEVLGRSSALGSLLASLGMPVTFSLFGAVIAAFVVGLPLHVLCIRAAFEGIDPRIEEMGLTLGLTPRQVALRVSLPLAFPGILAGTVLCFARALGEFGATVVVAGNLEGRTRTIALAVYSLLEAPGGEAAVALLTASSIALAAACLVIFEALNRWYRRRLGLV